MDETNELTLFPCIQVQIAGAILEIGKQVDGIYDIEVRGILKETMRSLHYSIDPPRGELMEVEFTPEVDDE